MKNVVMFDKGKYAGLHEEIDEMSIAIPKDIIEVGIINSLNMIGEIQAYMDRLSGMLGEALQNSTLLKNLAEKLKSQYTFKEEDYLVNDLEVKKQSSQQLRVAKAHSKKDMIELSDKLIKIRNLYNKANMLVSRINGKYSFFEKSYDMLSRQLSGLKQAWIMGDMKNSQLEQLVADLEKKDKGKKFGE